MPDEKFEVVIGAKDQASPVLDKFNQNLKTTQTTTQKVTSGLQTMANKSKWAFAAMSGAVVGVTKVYADFENVMAKVATQLPGEAMENYEEFTRAVQDMSVEFGQSTTVMAQGLYDILSAAIEPEKALQLLEQSAKTAAAGFTDVATTADLFTSILNAYGMEVEDAAHISDVLFQSVFRGKMEFEDMATELGSIMGVAAQAGVSLEDLGASLATLTRSGIDTAEAVTGIRQAILSYIDPGKEALETAAELGIEFNSTALATDGLINSIAKLTGATQEQLSALFPNVRALVAVQGILGDLDGALEDLRLNQEAYNTTNEAFAKATDTTKFSIDQLKSSVQVLVQEFGEAMLPAIEEILDSFKNLINRIRDLDEEQKRALGDLLINLTKLTGLVVGLNLVANTIMAIGRALQFTYALLGPWGIAIGGIVASLALLDRHSDAVIGFFEDLGRELGLVNDEMASFYDHTTDLDPDIKRLEQEISETTSKIASLEEEFAKLREKNIGIPPDLIEDWNNLNTLLKQQTTELNKLTGAQPEAVQGIIETKEGVADLEAQMKAALEPIDKTAEGIEKVGDTSEQTAKEIENLRGQLKGIVDDANWTILTTGASDYEVQLLTLERQYKDTVATIEAMALPAAEKARAIETVTEAYTLSVERLAESAKEELRLLAEEASWATLMEKAGTGIEARMLIEERRYKEAVERISSYPVEFEEEKNAVLEAERERHYTILQNLLKEAIENELREQEARAQRELEEYRRTAEEEKAILEAKNNKLAELNKEYFERNATDLEILVKNHKDKYDEILSMFEWTEQEKVEISRIANDDILYQLNDFTARYVDEMRKVGATDEEIAAGIEDIIRTLEELGVSTEIVAQFKEQWAELPPVIKESKDQIDDIISVIGDIGDIMIGVSFGEKPTAGAIGGVVGGILGLFAGIPTWIGSIVNMVFGWIDDIQQRSQEAIEEAYQHIQTIIDDLSGQLHSAMVDLFMEPDLNKAMEDFGQRLDEIVYNVMVEAIVSAIITSEAVQGAIEDLGRAIGEAIETGSYEGLDAALSTFYDRIYNEAMPVLEYAMSYIRPYSPYRKTFSGRVPEYQSGGYVPYTGLALLHAGEYVVPKEEVNTVSFGDIEINVNTTGGVDGADLWNEFEREARRRGVSLVQ